MIRACIFDLDGTLCDSVESIAYCANHALRDLGMKEASLEDYKIFVGDGVDMLVRRLLRFICFFRRYNRFLFLYGFCFGFRFNRFSRILFFFFCRLRGLFFLCVRRLYCFCPGFICLDFGRLCAFFVCCFNDEFQSLCVELSQQSVLDGGLMDEARKNAEQDIRDMFNAALGSDYPVEFEWREPDEAE